MNKKILATIAAIVVYALSAHPTVAADLAIHTMVANIDPRIAKLEAFLNSYNSPMADSAAHFIKEADRLGLDWKLVPAIAGVESTFGKRIPPNSYNSYGWGVFTGQKDGIHFTNWDDGITKVSEGLKYRYVDRGAVSIEQMGRIYAASPTWAQKVRFFVNKLEAFEATKIVHLAVTI